MRRPRRPRSLWPARHHVLPGVLLLVATMVIVVGWERASSAASGLLYGLLGWAAPVVWRVWPLLAAIALIVLTSPRGQERLRRIPHAGRVAAIVGGLAVGVVGWMAWPAARGWLLAAGLVVVVGLLAAWVLLVPDRLAPPPRPEELEGLSDRERLELADARVRLRNDIRSTALQAVAGLAVLAGAVLGFQQLVEDRRALTDQLTLTRQGQASERFTRAIDQLGSDRMETRIGGIYGLEQIARQVPDNRLSVTEVLIAYVRRRIPLPANHQRPEHSQVDFDRAPDVQAALTVLGRRHVEPTDPSLDLRLLDLGGVDLRGANLGGADLMNTSMAGAYLDGANLAGADMRDVDLFRAYLTGADLRDADLSGADLNGILDGVDLRGANLAFTNLSTAVLDGADLRGALANDRTSWPEGFDRQAAGVQLS